MNVNTDLTTEPYHNAAIGGNCWGSGGNLIIHGGRITASSYGDGFGAGMADGERTFKTGTLTVKKSILDTTNIEMREPAN